MKHLLLVATVLFLTSCGGKRTSTVPGEKTDECLFKEEVCREADNFQDEYYSMDEEEREKMTAVLNSYIEHCEVASKACKKSMR